MLVLIEEEEKGREKKRSGKEGEKKKVVSKEKYSETNRGGKSERESY